MKIILLISSIKIKSDWFKTCTLHIFSYSAYSLLQKDTLLRTYLTLIYPKLTGKISSHYQTVAIQLGVKIFWTFFTTNPTLVDNVSSDHDIVLAKVNAKHEITNQVPRTIL